MVMLGLLPAARGRPAPRLMPKKPNELRPNVAETAFRVMPAATVLLNEWSLGGIVPR